MRIVIFPTATGVRQPHSRTERAYRGFAAFVAILAIFAATAVGGCAVKLAPDYDKAVIDGLTKANEDAMILFASVTTGPYSKRDAAYDTVIGELNAVQVQIKARGTPAPPSVLFRVAAPAVDKKTLSDALEAPTSGDVDTLLRIVNAARRDDQNGRIKGRIDFIIEAFAIQMAQALTYEKALQR
jgi:hypothetical protein